MTWSRFDDGARKHPKAVIAGNDAWAFWCASVMYCNQYGTDGFVPDAALSTELLPVPISKPKAKALAERLCRARTHEGAPSLFTRDEKRKGYIVHDFLDWNPSKSEVDAKRRKDRDRKRGIQDDSVRIPNGNGTEFRSEFQTDSTRIPDGFHADSERPPRAPAPRARAPAPSPPSQPSPPIPDCSDLQASSKDLTRLARGKAPGGPAPCPPDLWQHVPEDTRMALELEGKPRWAQELHCRAFASQKTGRTGLDRAVERWVATWQQVLRTDWTDPAKRPVHPEPSRPDRSAELAAKHRAEVNRLDAEAAAAKARGELVGADVAKLVGGIG